MLPLQNWEWQFNIRLEVLDKAGGGGGLSIRKEEVNLSLFADNILAFIENPKESTKNH